MRSSPRRSRCTRYAAVRSGPGRDLMRATLRTAGLQIDVDCTHRRLAGVIAEGAAGELAPVNGRRPDIRVTVEQTAAAFDVSGWDPLTRGAWRRPGQVMTGQVMMSNACSSGLDMLITADGPTLEVVARQRPTAAGRAASALLRARATLLIRAVLLQYPALWWAQQRGWVPLHASVYTLASPGCGTVLIAGPGGIGKSTLMAAELTGGARPACDNLCVSDGHTAWGLVEPRRIPADVAATVAGRSTTTGWPARRGRRMPYGRREAPWVGRAESQVPNLVVVLRRGNETSPTVTAITAEEAARVLVAGSYMAGELRRYWAFAATLALGTGVGEPHPAIGEVARMLARRLPCHVVVLGGQPGASLGVLLGSQTISR